VKQSPYNPDLDLIRGGLIERRERIAERVGKFAEPPERGAAQGFGKRVGDGTVEAIGRLTEIGVGTSLEAGLIRVERALTKIDEGTYGRCDACGELIPEPRLRAMPDAVTCIACSTARERRPPGRR
jgi:DnaK suppressor protein